MPESGALAGKAVLQPPVAYLPCRLDDEGNLDEVMMVELDDGRIALLGYTALDRFLAACGDAHPWVLWQTAELERLRELKRYDVAYLDVPLPRDLRVQSDQAQQADPTSTDQPATATAPETGSDAGSDTGSDTGSGADHGAAWNDGRLDGRLGSRLGSPAAPREGSGTTGEQQP